MGSSAKMTLRTSVTVTSFLTLVVKIFGRQTPTCHQGEYQIGDRCCPLCPAGCQVELDCTISRSTSCVPCTAGTFMNQTTARRQCYICATCDAAFGLKIKRSCTTISDTVCEPLEGFYCQTSTDERCMEARKRTRCQPGQYITKKGTSSADTECSDCTDGTFSDGTFTVCQPHTQCELKSLQLIKAGTASADAECEENSSNHTGIVIGAVIIGVILLLGAVFFLNKQRWKRNLIQKKELLNRGEKTVDPSV